jgi:hypothetical protein
MHHLCYFNTSNIEITETPATHPQEEMWAEIIPTIPKMRHADLDELFAKLRSYRRGKRDIIVQRRSTATYLIESKIRNIRSCQISAAKRAAFIGPLTGAMQNGHPF